uniref:TSA: Wollemia nobilis Ref_Wollemi_Transcript_7916_3074 transcribed RNA sequence n=1 Tax=Wollemia nobilis TaxID=56998 RepID=A0A0C9QUU9_9CONI
MSGLSKRLHEEGTHQSGGLTAKRQHDESLSFPNSAGKTNPSSSDHYCMTEADNDGRLTKIQRTESRDVERRSGAWGTPYRYLSMDEHYSEIPGSESRGEVRDTRENRDVKLESRECKGDTRDPRNDSRLDSRDIKGEREMKLEARGDIRDSKIERDYHLDPKGDSKPERDRRERGETRENWKELKDHYYGGGDHESSIQHSRYPDDFEWHTGGKETGKESLLEEDGEFCEAKEAVGENKVEWKREEKEKERDRKRDRDRERDDWRNNLQLNSNVHERKDNIREDRDTDRWERDRERKDRGKDKERQKDKERDHSKKERSERDDRESMHIEKAEMEVSRKALDEENPELEQKAIKESDGWKNTDRDEKERKKERDKDAEVDRHEKRMRLVYEKDIDEASAEGGVVEREREGFSYGVQQRKRMLRPRGHSQATTREPRYRSRPKDIDGSQGRSEASAVVYKVGECMQEIIKLWKEFEASQATNNGESSSGLSPTLEIRIPAEHVTTTNRQVKGSQLWGTDIYTDDSDLVAVLMHTGYYRPTATPPPPAIHELRATIRVLPPQDSYTSTLRNSVRSRAWGAASGCSYQVERCRIMKKGGGSIELEPCLMRFSAVAPTLAPAAMERTMTTRSAASSAYRQQRYAREVTIQYNLCNEPWMKYSISIVADRGLKKSQYTSARLKKGEVLYVETHTHRYELSYDGEKALCNGSTTATSAPSQPSNPVERGMDKTTIGENDKHHAHGGHSQNGDKSQGRGNHEGGKGTAENFDRFKWARCKQPLPQKVMRAIGIPLPPEYVEVLEENLDWEETQWSQTGVWVRGIEYPLARAHFLSSN